MKEMPYKQKKKKRISISDVEIQGYLCLAFTLILGIITTMAINENQPLEYIGTIQKPYEIEITTKTYKWKTCGPKICFDEDYCVQDCETHTSYYEQRTYSFYFLLDNGTSIDCRYAVSATKIRREDWVSHLEYEFETGHGNIIGRYRDGLFIVSELGVIDSDETD